MIEPLTSLEHARRLDANDPLSVYRERFVVDDPDLIYLDGNSLGRLPVAAAERLTQVVRDQWGERLVRGWSEGWFELPERIGAKVARVLGAQEDEVILADSTSVNLFKLCLSALLALPDRTTIITDDLNFPSDLYILQGIVKVLGRGVRLQVIPSSDGIHGSTDALIGAIDEETALVTLSHTTFKSSFTYDMNAVNQAAHRF